MLFYEDTGRSLYAWNAVDVEIDGRLRHGYVVGLEETESASPRLLVDLGCPTQEAVLVEYGKVWDCSRHVSSNASEGAVVEVLLYDGPHWTWYPGIILIARFDELHEMALVEVLVDEQRRRELLPTNQIRDAADAWGQTARSGLLGAGEFVMQACNVPNGYWAMEPSAAAFLLKQVESRCNLRIVTVLSWTMHYLRRHGDLPLSDQVLATAFEDQRSKHDFGWQTEFLDENEELDVERKRRMPLSQLNVGEKDRLTLPLAVLKEIFHSLDTIDRVRFRRTCPLWADILIKPEICSEVILPRPQYSFWDNYVLYTGLAKHVTPATRTICIRESGMYSNDVFDAVQRLLQDAGIRLARCIVHRRSLAYKESTFTRWKFALFTDKVAEPRFRLESCCDRVIFKDLAVVVQNKWEAPLLEFRVPLIVFTRGAVDEADVVDLFEKHLHYEGPPVDVQQVAHFMGNRIITAEGATIVKKILRNYQSSDPRPSAQYREHRWCVYNVAGVDVGRLNRFSLCVLWRYTQYWSAYESAHPVQLAPSDPESESDE
ncbi:uncharacterized protein LOC129583068 isoform X2 [Paramacrobiotus metropolitanus]|nr:uncharacterized protein LOC129583068 isoform X2 [Paramacrobiotus metropolitanus]XP_055330744.1 uncharacterized protein LOC129583068 isoform X2 [Paramacrobiotus metropolitanus]XP_055330745.1 uncharacterized protein LOC129583068 isoform X2 [Paramacrobiotus metropolitanus]